MKTLTASPARDVQDMRAWARNLSTPPQGEVKGMLVEALLTLLLNLLWP